jgi:hypothetical protein
VSATDHRTGRSGNSFAVDAVGWYKNSRGIERRGYAALGDFFLVVLVCVGWDGV